MNTEIMKNMEEFLRSGDKGALGKVFSFYLEHLYRVAYLICRNREDAEDVVQQVFLELMRKKIQIDGVKERDETKLKCWLSKVCINMAKTYIRKRISDRKRDHIVSESKSEVINTENSLDLGQKLEELIKGLPVKYSLPLKLKYQEDMSYQEISNVLSLKQTTIRSQINRGLDILRLRMGGAGKVLSVLALIKIIHHQKLDAAPQGLLSKCLELDPKSSISQNYGVKLTMQKSSTLKTVFLISSICASILAATIYYREAVNKDISTQLNPTKNTNNKQEEEFWEFKEDNRSDFTLVSGGWRWDSKNAKIVHDPDKSKWVDGKEFFRFMEKFNFFAFKINKKYSGGHFFHFKGNVNISKGGSTISLMPFPYYDNRVWGARNIHREYKNKDFRGTNVGIEYFVYFFDEYVIVEEKTLGTTSVNSYGGQTPKEVEYVFGVGNIELISIYRRNMNSEDYQDIRSSLSVLNIEAKEKDEILSKLK